MARFRILISFAVASISACLVLAEMPTAAAKTYRVDALHSSLLFRVKHLNTSYLWGRFNEFSGTVNLDDASPSLEVQVKVDSVDTADSKRDQHLEGPDFFSAKQYPTISFESTKVTKTGKSTYDVEGTLTLHGVSRPITVQLERTGTNPGLRGGTITGLTTTFKIKRSDYGMKFMLAGASDEVLIIVSLECAAK